MDGIIRASVVAVVGLEECFPSCLLKQENISPQIKPNGHSSYVKEPQSELQLVEV